MNIRYFNPFRLTDLFRRYNGSAFEAHNLQKNYGKQAAANRKVEMVL